MLTKHQIEELTEARNLLVKAKNIIDKNKSNYNYSYFHSDNEYDNKGFKFDILYILNIIDDEIKFQNHEKYKKENYRRIKK